MHTVFSSSQKPSPRVVAIGNFDGGHLGHQALIKTLCQTAEQHQADSWVITFEPLTHEFFAGARQSRLMSFRDKTQWLKAEGVNHISAATFNAKHSELTAEEFITRYLKSNHVVHAVMGEDFRFGAKRQGSYHTLQAFGIEVTLLPEVKMEDRISSSQIRHHLINNQLDLASQLLGRPYTFSGVVRRGQQRGRLLGFPTANLSLNRCPIPLNGVFEVNVLIQNKKHRGVANIGTRPTVDGQRRWCEVHILNFSEDLYGQRIGIEPIAFIRYEKKFDSPHDLKKQIEQDVLQVTQ